jgi:transcriptional regulator with XRE-family HTH domain
MMPRVSATEINQIVGARITVFRKLKSISQTALAGAMGFSYQQLQKYEKGSNRINAARLQAIANYLDVPICDLYGNENGSFSRDENIKFISLPGAIDLLKAFAEIESMEMRRNVLAIAHTAARISVGATATDA